MKEPSLNKTLRKTLQEVLSVPTAPYAEHFLIRHLEHRFAKFSKLKVNKDSFGNLLIEFRGRAKLSNPLCFHAHLDHPGFGFIRATSRGRGIAEALGGVPEKCVGAKIQFFNSETEIVSAKVLRFIKKSGKKFVTLSYRGEIKKGAGGMWQFEPFVENKMWIEGRGFDDNLGTATLTFLLEEACRKNFSHSFKVLFTRAEEVQYIGAIAMLQAKSWSLPRTILTVEMPRASGGIVSGKGVVVRAGDSMGDFSPTVSLALIQQAKLLERKYKWFKMHRALGLLGGTECTVFQLSGHEVGALCLPVVNMHNKHRSTGRPAREKIRISDYMALVIMLQEIAKRPWDGAAHGKNLKEKLFKEARSGVRRLAIANKFFTPKKSEL